MPRLLEQIRGTLDASPFHGEGHRKVWARLRFAGLRTSRHRVLRLMRERGWAHPGVPATTVVQCNICGTAPQASAFSDDVPIEDGAVICPAFERGITPLALMKSATQVA